jgi:hypothetical protein
MTATDAVDGRVQHAPVRPLVNIYLEVLFPQCTPISTLRL